MAKGFEDQARSDQVQGKDIDLYGQVMPQGPQPEEEAQELREAQEAQKLREAQEAQDTRGKKGMKMPRINMAFTPSNLEFITVMSRLYKDEEGKVMSMTKYVNSLIAAERERKADVYQKAKDFLKDQ